MINPYCFTDGYSKRGSKINLDSHNIIQANSLLTIIPTYPDFGIETRNISKFMKKWLLFTLDY